jgi:hypothetical protein
VFTIALSIHILAGLTCVAAGTLAATARKAPGRHPKAGRVYLWGLAAVFATTTAMAVLRWPAYIHLLAIATVAAGLGLFGWLARRRERFTWHGIGMGGSFIALFTGFYVDNGPRLPVWRLLPHWSYWIIPAAVGVPLIWRAISRFAAGPRPRAPRGTDWWPWRRRASRSTTAG